MKDGVEGSDGQTSSAVCCCRQVAGGDGRRAGASSTSACPVLSCTATARSSYAAAMAKEWRCGGKRRRWRGIARSTTAASSLQSISRSTPALCARRGQDSWYVGYG